MNKRFILALVCAAISCFGAFGQKKHYTVTEKYMMAPPLEKDLVGSMTYSFYKSDEGEKVKDGTFKFNGTMNGTEGRTKYSSTYAISGGYKDGVLDGTFSAKGHDTATNSSGTWTADYGASFKLIEGVPDGNMTAWITDSDLTQKLSVDANFSNGKLVGDFIYDAKEEGLSGLIQNITGQFTEDGKLTGEWMVRKLDTDILNFKNSVLVDNGFYMRWTDELRSKAEEYADGRISKEDLLAQGYKVMESTLRLDCLGDFVTAHNFLSLTHLYLGDIDFSCTVVPYEYLVECTRLTDAGAEAIAKAYEDHISQGRKGIKADGVKYRGYTDGRIASKYPDDERYMISNVLPRECEGAMITGDSSGDEILMSVEQYKAITDRIQEASVKAAKHYYDYMDAADRNLIVAGKSDDLLDKYGAAKLSEMLAAISSQIKSGELTEDGAYYRTPDSFNLTVAPERDNILNVDDMISIESEYKAVREEIGKLVVNKKKKAVKEVVYDSMLALAPENAKFSQMRTLTPALKEALEILDGGKIFDTIAAENDMIKSSSPKELSSSTANLTGVIIGDGKFTSTFGLATFLENLEKAKKVQTDAKGLLELSKEVTTSEKYAGIKYGKTYKEQYKTFDNEFNASTPKLDFASIEQLEGKIETFNKLQESVDAFNNMCSLADQMNSDFINAKKAREETVAKFSKKYKEQCKTFTDQFNVASPSMEFKTTEEVIAKIERCKALSESVVEFEKMCLLADQMNSDYTALKAYRSVFEKSAKKFRKELKPFLKELDAYDTKPEFKTIEEVEEKIEMYQELHKMMEDFKAEHGIQ